MTSCNDNIANRYADSNVNNKKTGRVVQSCVYLKGHVGAWSPRQPQWQHWGALWLTDEQLVLVAECIATGTEAADGEWHDEVVVEKVVFCDEACMA